MDLYETLHHMLTTLVEYGSIFFEAAGVLILLWAGIRGVIQYCRGYHRTHLELAHGMSMALGFMLGGEILSTVTAESYSQCLPIAFLVVLRASMTLLLHWESKSEEKEIEKEEEKEKKNR